MRQSPRRASRTGGRSSHAPGWAGRILTQRSARRRPRARIDGRREVLEVGMHLGDWAQQLIGIPGLLEVARRQGRMTTVTAGAARADLRGMPGRGLGAVDDRRRLARRRGARGRRRMGGARGRERRPVHLCGGGQGLGVVVWSPRRPTRPIGTRIGACRGRPATMPSGRTRGAASPAVRSRRDKGDLWLTVMICATSPSWRTLTMERRRSSTRCSGRPAPSGPTRKSPRA